MAPTLDQATLDQAALDSLIKSERRYRRLFETARDGILLVDAESGAIQAANPYICGLLLRSEESIIGDYLWELGPLKDVIPSKANFLELQQKKYIRYEDMPLETPAGKVVHVEFISNVYAEGDSNIIQCNIRDVSERFESKRKLEHYYQTLRTINTCNTSLVHSTSERALSDGICKALVVEGRYAATWVGLLDHTDEMTTLQPISAAGIGLAALPKSITIDEMSAHDVLSRVVAMQVPIILDNPIGEQRLPSEITAIIDRENYQSCAVIPVLVGEQLSGVLCVLSIEANRFDQDSVDLLSDLARDMGFGLSDIRIRVEHAANQRRLLSSFDEAIAAIATTTELRDPYTAGHQARVAELAKAIAEEMGLSQEIQATVLMAGEVHDIGKIQVPAEILSHPGHLTPAQFEIIKMHPLAGYNILKEISFTQPIAEIVKQHHERLDGSGYPDGLMGQDILIEAQIIGVADTVEAMASHRPYRPGLGLEPALAEIAKQKGKAFNPEAVDACIRLFKEKNYALTPV